MLPNASRELRLWLMLLALGAYWLYAFSIGYFEYAAPCLRGGEGMLPGLFFGGPILFGATVLVWLMRESISLSAAMRASLMASLAVAALVVVPQLYSVTLMGHHPCGSEFDMFNNFVERHDRLVPAVNLALIAVAAVVGLGPYVRKVERQTTV